MTKESGNSHTFEALDQKFAQLTSTVNLLQEHLSKTRSAAIPSLVYEGVAQLFLMLPQVYKNISSIEDERQSLRELAQIGEIVNSSLELNDVLQRVMDTIIRLTEAERGFLMLMDENNELQIRVARNWEQESLDHSEVSFSKTIINRVVNGGLAVLTTNAQDDPRFTGQESVVTYNLRSILCVPLIVKGKLTGVIYADNRIRSGLFSQKQLDLLSDFANQAAVALENASLFDSVRKTLVEVTELKNLTENIFTSIASGVVTFDKNKCIVMCNRAAEEILKKSAGELIGSPLAVTLPDYSELLDPYLERVLKFDHRIVGLDASIKSDGFHHKDLRFSLTPLKDIELSTQGVAVVMDDLTEIKHLEARQRLFKRMVSPAVIEQIDPNSV
ncbi:MAG: GAF domain-containing protein, partial [Anaerolineae bacterium]|nr:GAF domain-containing protein [Anaerolineae bacterium]